MQVRQRNDKIDYLRGIAAILMILGHSFIVHPVDISQIPWCDKLGEFIYQFHMELFFILAGWVYQCTDYKSFIKKKINRLAVPYFVFGAGALILRAVGGSLINGVEPLHEGIFQLLFSGGGYWFLYVLLIIFAIYPF